MKKAAATANSIGEYLSDFFAETRDTLLQVESQLLQRLPKKAVTIGWGIATGLLSDMCTQNIVDTCHIDNPLLSRFVGPVVGLAVGAFVDNLKDPDEDGEAPHLMWKAVYA